MKAKDKNIDKHSKKFHSKVNTTLQQNHHLNFCFDISEASSKLEESKRDTSFKPFSSRASSTDRLGSFKTNYIEINERYIPQGIQIDTQFSV